MDKYITVWYESKALLVRKEVAAKIGIQHGYRVKNETELWSIIGKNAQYSIREIDLIQRKN
ncbi:MAG: hypothetical protein HRU05_00430 [Oceanospirillaceae bacterium]|nr:hypothetical protein [Oceanospirillaceae bacterium]